jgi:hypothetical protein
MKWIQQLAEQAQPANRPLRHIADVICENMKNVPPEIMATMPKDGASQHDHYIYGWPKREVLKPMIGILSRKAFARCSGFVKSCRSCRAIRLARLCFLQ